MTKQNVGIIVFCTDRNGTKKYLLGEHSTWVRDVFGKNPKWDKSWETLPDSTRNPRIVFDAAKTHVYNLVKNKSLQRTQIVHADGKYKTKWVVSHSKPLWGFPKGGCLPREDHLLCGKREFKEEVLSTLPGSFRDTLSFYHDLHDTDYEFFVYEVEYDIMERILEEFPIKKGTEGTELIQLKSFTKTDLDTLNVNDVTKKALQLLFKRRPNTRRRSRKRSNKQTRRH